MSNSKQTKRDKKWNHICFYQIDKKLRKNSKNFFCEILKCEWKLDRKIGWWWFGEYLSVTYLVSVLGYARVLAIIDLPRTSRILLMACFFGRASDACTTVFLRRPRVTNQAGAWRLFHIVQLELPLQQFFDETKVPTQIDRFVVPVMSLALLIIRS